MNHTLQCAVVLALLAAGPPASAAELAVSIEIPQLDVAEYHRPYVAAWVEREDRTVAANLAVWYDVGNRDGARWLADLRQWWRRSGREQRLPIDAVTGATRPVGRHDLTLVAGRAPLGDFPPGKYTLVVEAVREVGGREALRVPFEWPAESLQRATVNGSAEIGVVSVTIAP